MRALSPPSFTRHSSKGLLGQAVGVPEARAPSPSRGSPERSRVSAAGSIPGGKKPPTPHNKQTRRVLIDSDESEAEPTPLGRMAKSTLSFGIFSFWAEAYSFPTLVYQQAF